MRICAQTSTLFTSKRVEGLNVKREADTVLDVLLYDLNKIAQRLQSGLLADRRSLCAKRANKLQLAFRNMDALDAVVTKSIIPIVMERLPMALSATSPQNEMTEVSFHFPLSSKKLTKNAIKACESGTRPSGLAVYSRRKSVRDVQRDTLLASERIERNPPPS